MAPRGRPRVHATHAEKIHAYRQRKRLAAAAPEARRCQMGACTLYCSAWEPLYPLLPRDAAVVTDPPYQVRYDYTKARRRPSQWAHNFVGADQPFDPTPWLQFADVILFGADRYWDRLPPGGSWICWDKLAGTTPAAFAASEWIWTSHEGPPAFIPHLWRGGQRAGEENISRLQQKYHPVQKPISVLQRCLQRIPPGRVVVDPFMGSGSTLVACVRAGYPCIGIEIDPTYFATACARVEAELQQLALFPSGDGDRLGHVEVARRAISRGRGDRGA